MTSVVNKAILELTPSSTEEDAKETYDAWAATYEKDTDEHGYNGHVLCMEAFNRAMQSEEIFPGADKNLKILDAGAGTGIIGEMLVKQGYTNVDALDISPKMLDIAEKKNIYKRLICAPLSDVRIDQIQTAEYDVTLCAGTIVYGQAKPVALDECIRHVRPGGLFIFSIRADSFDPKELGYSTKFEELEKLGKWSLVNRELRELYSNPNEERYRNCYLISYKVLKN